MAINFWFIDEKKVDFITQFTSNIEIHVWLSDIHNCLCPFFIGEESTLLESTRLTSSPV